MAEGGEEKPKGLTGLGITEDEEKLLQALHLLGIKPNVGSVEDVTKLLHLFGDSKTEPEPAAQTSDASHKHVTFQFPKLPLFFGEEGKGEVNWTSFRYEVEALLCEGMFKDEQILLGIRRACKGKAADCIRRLGPGVTVKDVMGKFESEYGSIESRESILRKFYGCTQNPDESVSSFASRLEEIFDQAVLLKAIKKSDTILLKEVLHSGLRKDLKHLSFYQCDKIAQYDEFKKELRRLEASLAESEKDKGHTCKAALHTDSSSQSNVIAEMKELLKSLHDRIDHLEKTKVTDHTPYRGGYRGRGFRGRNINDRGRGRGFSDGNRGHQLQTTQTLGNQHQPNQNYGPTCYNCNQKGHIQKFCPSLLKDVTCYNCNQKGHKKYNCPNW